MSSKGKVRFDVIIEDRGLQRGAVFGVTLPTARLWARYFNHKAKKVGITARAAIARPVTVAKL